MGWRLTSALFMLASLAVLFYLLRSSGVETGPEQVIPGPHQAETSPARMEPGQPVLRGVEAARPEDPDTAHGSPGAESRIRIRLRGRVVDDRRIGVGDVHVALVVAGQPLLETRTETDGAYRFEGAVPSSPRVAWMGATRTSECDCVVRALADDGRTGHLALPLSERAPDEGDLVLSPLVLAQGFELAIRVLGEGRPVSGARVRIGGGPHDHRKSWVWRETVVTDATGHALVTALPRGTAGLYVTADGWGPAVTGTGVPAASDVPLEVRLPARSFTEVLVQEEGTDRPVPDATVTLVVMMPKPDRGWVQLGPAEGVARTDASGVTRVPVFADGSRAWAYVRAPDRPQTVRASNAEMQWKAPQTVVEVPAPNSLSWVVVPGDGPLPPDGTEVHVTRGNLVYDSSGFLTPEKGLIADGRLVVPHAAAKTEHRAYNLIAVLPDGRCALATVERGESQGAEVAFLAPRTLTVRVVDHEGRPVSGAGLRLSDCRSASLHERPLPTDEQGLCTLTPLLPETVRIRLYGIGTCTERQEEDVDLTTSDQTVEFRLPLPQQLCVRVLVDGEPRLPPTWRLRVGKQRVGMRQVHEEAATGTIRATLLCADGLPGAVVRMEAEGLGTATGTAEWDAAAGAATVTLTFGARRRILARVKPPADGQYELFLERFVRETRTFNVTAPSVAPEAAQDGVFEFGPLEAGRYRLRERFAHRVSDTVEVTAASGDVELPFDLSGMGLVHGHIEAPGKSGMALARVVASHLPDTIPVAADGTFRLHVPGDRAITLEAWHPFLLSTRSVTVREPREDVTLGLRRGPTATFVLDREPTRDEQLRLEGSLLLYRAGSWESPVWRCPTLVSGREIFIGRFEPGTWSVILDPGTRAPIVLHDVQLGPGATRIEDVEWVPGSRVLFEVLWTAGAVRPALGLSATALDGPPYSRSRWVHQPDEPLELTGLGPGRFRITVHGMSETRTESEEVFSDVVVVYGAGDARVRVDLR